MGGRLIRRWWGERRDTESDWFTVWISASMDVQSWRFLLGLSCRFNSSLYQCVHMHVCVGVHMCVGVCVYVCVCAAQLVGDREGRNVYGWFTAEPLRTVSGPGTPDNCRCCSAVRTLQNQSLPWWRPVNPIHFLTSWHMPCLHFRYRSLAFGSCSECEHENITALRTKGPWGGEGGGG